MRNDGYIKNIQDLHDWFMRHQTGKDKMPFFLVHSGFDAKPDRIIAKNNEIDDPERAWELLEENIIAQSADGGRFRVFVRSEPNTNHGMVTRVLIPGPSGSQSGIAGVQGVGMWGIYSSPQEMVQAEVDRRMEVYELRRELEDMRAGQAALSGVDQFKQLIADVPALNALIQAAGMKLLGMNPQGHPIAPQHIPGTAAPADGIQGAEPEGYDYDVVEPALDKMRRVFPDVEMTLDRLADWVSKNPDQAKMIFGNLQQS